MSRTQHTTFRDIDFGSTTAEAEGSRNPRLLLDGYLDLPQVRYQTMTGPKFLFLGYKGAGKSAIAEHLNLQPSPSRFVTKLFLSDFLYAQFGQIVQGPTEGPSRYPTAWSWLILLYILASLDRDQGAESKSDPDFQKTINLLRRLSLIPTPSLQEAVTRSTTRALRTTLGKLLQTEFGVQLTGTGINIQTAVETLRRTAENFKTASRHIIVIDGLDDVLLRGPIQSESLAALVLEVSRLNLRFQSHNSCTKILLMCRTDLYERLPGPNKNKIRQDSAIHLEWFNPQRAARNATLIGLANLKARVTMPDVVDLFLEYFPPTMPQGAKKTPISIHRYLLSYTRYTPRDFLQILRYLQDYYIRGQFTQHQIRNGIRHYSENYFLPEMKDELVGHLDAEVAEQGFDLLARLGKPIITPGQFVELAKRSGLRSHRNVDFLALLFEFGAVGNITEPHPGKFHYTFRYRNRHTPFNPDRRIQLHRALLPALNVLTNL